MRTEDFTVEDSKEVAHIHGLTRAAGLSLGDCACLALGKRLSATVLTADARWASVAGRVGVRVRPIR